VIVWFALVIVEFVRSGAELPTAPAYYQAAALALVFAGYVMGWHKEFAGGALAIIGTAAFFAVNVLTFGALPLFGAVWFALPGVLYLLAWQCDRAGTLPSVTQR
jgi:hypothetical protein